MSCFGSSVAEAVKLFSFFVFLFVYKWLVEHISHAQRVIRRQPGVNSSFSKGRFLGYFGVQFSQFGEIWKFQWLGHIFSPFFMLFWFGIHYRMWETIPWVWSKKADNFLTSRHPRWWKIWFFKFCQGSFLDAFGMSGCLENKFLSSLKLPEMT